MKLSCKNKQMNKTTKNTNLIKLQAAITNLHDCIQQINYKGKRVYRFKKTRKQITNYKALFNPDSSNCKPHILDIFETTSNSNED